MGLLLIAALAVGACERDRSKPIQRAAAARDGGAAAPTDGPAFGGATMQVRLGGDPNEEGPRLPFTIDAVHEGQEATMSPPWHRPGGKWTFLDARTSGGVPFTVGLLETRRVPNDKKWILYDARIAV